MSQIAPRLLVIGTVWPEPKSSAAGTHLLSLINVFQRNGYECHFACPANHYEAQHTIDLSALNTSNYFKTGHQIRIEVSSSNFPRFTRNLNTGGNNYDEKVGVVAHNKVHHSSKHPSQISLPIAKK